jgi:peptidoglycan/xylan/chitin deacetylase (PgdA/CDA1 family)
MFFIVNKDKFFAYIVSILTVALLFGVASISNFGETIETSATAENLLPIYNVEIEEKKVAFTMNCAWSADDIDDILKILDDNDVKITFFMVGEWVAKNPEAVKKIAEAGHEIGSHSNTHPHVNELSYEENLSEIRECNEKIEKLTGIKPSLYRTPYGEYNNTVLQAVADEKCLAIQWNLDTLDYEGLTGEQMWARIGSKLSNGAIILSHNGTDHTADSLDMLIKNIKEQGYEIVKVSDIIYKDNYIINSSGTQVQQ